MGSHYLPATNVKPQRETVEMDGKTLTVSIYPDGMMSCYVHGTPFYKNYHRDGAWYRTDQYYSNTDKPWDEKFPTADTFRCTGPDDNSPPWSGYDSECSACYLGIKHTTVYHERRVA